ncbi:flagellar motor protein [Noviherbaspirillum aridicola]|uniref:Flagellar motor protein n=1 Tax=Noviherbaspirillum aridicola TaxID=2849687 RepID=A0ABQ4Q7H4_9BURK|nr:flagellar motor protein [Noviherbaspirillum aridicola]GIZ52654.1 flagellar motor protein [Noviherbaspirillum aridicola]
MDWASLSGLLLALAGIFIGQALEGGEIASLLQPTAFLIVAVGTMGAVLLQSGMDSFMRGMKMLRWVFRPPVAKSNTLRQDVLLWSATARREGLLSLERFVETVNDRFAQKGLRLIVDGIDPYKIREILETDITTHERRERQAVRIWEAAGGYSPTIGILGAVLGLIHVMENLSEPARLGSGIAVAFVATVYGVGLANLVYLPIAGKLKTLVGEEVRRREMLTDIFCSVANGDNARVVEERLLAYA